MPSQGDKIQVGSQSQKQGEQFLAKVKGQSQVGESESQSKG